MLTGPYTTVLKQSLEYMLAIGLSGYGLVYPLAIKYKWNFALWLETKGIPAPPIYVAPFFVAAAYLELGLLSFNEAEVAEVFVGLGLSLMALHYLHFSEAEISVSFCLDSGVHYTIALSFRILNEVFMVIVLSVATTFSMYATHDGKRRADNRIENGLEKFSGRYKNYENWKMVAFLNKKRLEKSPSSRWVLRNLGEAYQKMDNPELANKFLDKAIEIDLKKLQKQPLRASTNRSLVRTYRIIGDTVNSNKYLSQALEIGLSRIKKHPDSANALYSLGKTYILKGDIEKARPLFFKAYTIEPTDKAFRKKYYRYL